jgi:hypothetical protein
MELLLRSRPSPAAAAVAASIAFRLNPSHEEEEEEEIGVAMAGSSSANAGMGWPLGLRSCMVAQDAASPRVAEEESTASIAAVAAAAAQTSWLQAARLVEEAAAAAEQHNLVGGSFSRFPPYLSDASVSAAESSESDSDFQSETVTSSSFFKDSRRITLGSLIGLPMEYSDSGRAAAGGIHHHHLVDTHNHGRRRPGGRWSFTIANRSCGIRELLGSCGNCLQSSLGESLSEVILMDPRHPIGMSGQSLAACLELERRGDAALRDGANQAASSADGDRRRSSPEWSATQFVSCDSLLSDAEEEEEEEAEEEEEKKGYGSEQAATPFSHSTFSTSRNSNAINGVQRSSSSTMKSFLSTICCHMHPHQQP